MIDKAVNRGYNVSDILGNSTMPVSFTTPPPHKMSLVEGTKYAFHRMRNNTPRMLYGSKESRDGNCLFTGILQIYTYLQVC